MAHVLQPETERPLLNDGGDEASRSMKPYGLSRGAPSSIMEIHTRTFSPPNHFGPGEPHTKSPEERASLSSQLLFNWVTNMIRTSASGALPTGIVMPLSKCDKALTVSSSFFKFYGKERHHAHTWDQFVHSSSDLMRRHDDPDSRGVLAWIGCLQQSEDPAVIKVGIDWVKPPKAYRMGHVRFTDGTIDGEKLFHAPSGKATVELISSVRFVHCREADPAPAPRSPSLVKTLAFTTSKLFFLGVFPRLLYEACYLIQPTLLEEFVLFISGKGVSHGWQRQDQWLWGVFLALCFLLTSIGGSLAYQKFFHMTMRNGLNARSALMGQLFHKALTIAPHAAAHPDLSVGRVVNMMSSDVERINEGYGFFHYAWAAPLQLVVAVVLLYMRIGWIVFASLALTVFSAPLQGIIMKFQYGARQKLSSATDKRVKATNELFSAIRVIKFMGWEQSFVNQVLKFREIELGYLKKIQSFRVAGSFIVAAIPLIINAIVFILYHVTGHTLTPEVVFPVLALLNILRTPFMVIPWMFNLIITSAVAVRRLNRFLNADDAVSAVRELQRELPRDSNDDTDRSDDATYAAVLAHATCASYQPKEIKERRKKIPSVPQRIRKSLCGCVPSKPQVALAPVKEDTSSFHTVLSKELLEDITTSITSSQFTIIVGPTGSGKTLLLESILGNLTVTHGAIAASRSIAYAPQQSWIMNATVEDNVVFFDKVDHEKFDRAAKACCLDADLEQLADGAKTEIGERGVNVSGGQRARIALARAVYADRDVYLLDDPLAAVDAHVSKALVEKCLCGVLRSKTRVLVTHQHYVLPLADKIIAMDSGKIVFQGDYARYRVWATERSMLTPMTREATTDSPSAVPAPGTSPMKRDTFPVVPEGQAVGEGAGAGDNADQDVTVGPKEEDVSDEEGDKRAPGALMTVEERAQGNVPMSMYHKYLQTCGGYCRIAVILVIFAVTECFNASVQVWLALWASQSFNLEQDTYLYVYIGLVFTGAFNSAARAYIIYDTGRLGSRGLHERLLASVASAKVSFFDTTPLGRILNRFAKDVDTADNDLPMNYLGFLGQIFSILSSTVVMIVSQPFVIIALLPAGYIYSKVLVFYNAANREIKRVDSINKSPVFALISEVMEGAKTIAAFNKAPAVVAEAMHRIDAIFSTSYLQQVVNRWLGMRLDFLGNIIVFVIAIAAVVCHMLETKGFGDHVGMIGLGLTLSMQVTSQFNWFVRTSASVEANMNSIERIVHYSEEIDGEDLEWYGGPKKKKNPLPNVPLPEHLMKRRGARSGALSPSTSPPSSPAIATTATSGRLMIEFKEVQLRYRPELPLVLKNVSFKILPGQKVGIVGRTGSGKSTTLLAFLRIVDIVDGSIEIGGKRHTEFALEHLRALFAMIPQEPVLFTGTVRSNLDPFNEATDEAIRAALRQTGMLERVDKDGGINCDVSEAGKNFSVGQRQLLCLARALLKPSTGFILMDEATANIDPENDKLIQRTIRTAFADRTVITIAHRLATVIDSDQIVVMDAGEAKEVGTPRELVEKENGIFRSMIYALGTRERKKLIDIARRGSSAADDQSRASFENRDPLEDGDDDDKSDQDDKK
jgi:ATP-binding cassette subfamily C (CFTR/MRP) protein 1